MLWQSAFVTRFPTFGTLWKGAEAFDGRTRGSNAIGVFVWIPGMKHKSGGITTFDEENYFRYLPFRALTCNGCVRNLNNKPGGTSIGGANDALSIKPSLASYRRFAFNILIQVIHSEGCTTSPLTLSFSCYENTSWQTPRDNAEKKIFVNILYRWKILKSNLSVSWMDTFRISSSPVWRQLRSLQFHLLIADLAERGILWKLIS